MTICLIFDDTLLRKTSLRRIKSVVRERQLLLHWHVAHFPPEDPTHEIFFLPKLDGLDHAGGAFTGFIIASRDSYLRATGMVGLAFARSNLAPRIITRSVVRDERTAQ